MGIDTEPNARTARVASSSSSSSSSSRCQRETETNLDFIDILAYFTLFHETRQDETGRNETRRNTETPYLGRNSNHL